MKQFEYIQKYMQSVTSGKEMAELFGDIETAANIWCIHNNPIELCITKSGKTEVTIRGLETYLEKEYEYIQKYTQSITSGIEMATYLRDVEIAAKIWCIHHNPNELSIAESGKTEVTIRGLETYFENEVGIYLV